MQNPTSLSTSIFRRKSSNLLYIIDSYILLHTKKCCSCNHFKITSLETYGDFAIVFPMLFQITFFSKTKWI